MSFLKVIEQEKQVLNQLNNKRAELLKNVESIENEIEGVMLLIKFYENAALLN